MKQPEPLITGVGPCRVLLATAVTAARAARIGKKRLGFGMHKRNELFRQCC